MKDVRPESIVDVIESLCTQMTPAGEQMGLPGLEDYSMFNWYLIDDSTFRDEKSRRIIKPSNIEEAIENIERNNEGAIVVCLSQQSYQLFSDYMKRKAKSSGGITHGWGSSEHVIGGIKYLFYTFGINPQRVPPRYSEKLCPPPDK